MSNSFKAFAPATIANLACGFDILGLALNNAGDEVEVSVSDKPGVRLLEITGDSGLLPKEANKNTASVAAKALLDKLKLKHGLDIKLHKRLPLGSGLGSSASSAVAGVLAANYALGEPLAKEELLEFALEGELVACGSAHADNAGPSLLGGIILISSYAPLKTVKITAPKGLSACVVHPDIELKTAYAREILRKDLTLKQHINQSASLASFISALYTADYNLMRESIRDFIVEPQRSTLIPGFKAVQKAAISNGALGCSISGSGPSVFALTESLDLAKKVATAMQAEFSALGIQSDLICSEINNQGARLL